MVPEVDPIARMKPSRPSYAAARWWFHRLLGVVYLTAFGSLATQITGLAGRAGIVPAGVADGWLLGVCVAGAGLGAALAAGLAPIVVLPLAWGGWLWLSSVVSPFLNYQWDALLIETGLLAIVSAPLTLVDRRRDAADPPRLAVWLMWWLLFRLMAGSGAVKLTSGDLTWRDLTALTFHYETQPIPTPVAWYAHHLPAWLHKATTAATLAIELVAPFFIVGPRRLRVAGFILLAGLQAAIALTGNYAFFNLLSAALCVWMLDDEVFRREPGSPRGETSYVGRVLLDPPHLSRAIAFIVALVTVPVSLLHFTSSLGVAMPGWQLVAPIASAVAPLRSVNSYGLFAVMTVERPEIILEGSDDGQAWKAYAFKYKAGDLERRPPWVAPHQPRLDWQMWFAALGRFEEEGWLQNFCLRLLEGSPKVLALLDRDPFGGRPPRYLRAVLYRYRFSNGDAACPRCWWTRERLGDYSPVLSITGARSSP